MKYIIPVISIFWLMHTQILWANNGFIMPYDSTIYVDSSATTGLNDGSSWVNAYVSLQDALSAAHANALIDTVLVAKGTYYPTSGIERDTSFVIRDSLKVYGGFNPGQGVDAFEERNWSVHETILCGDIGMINDTSDNVYHVVQLSYVSDETHLDGLIIEGGNGNDPANDHDSGGGLRNIGSGNGNRSNPHITHCTFRNNYVTDNGGAIWNNGFEGEASPTITDCVFENNYAGNNGGAIDNNGANGGISSPYINRCVFKGNHSGQFGGAIVNYGSSGNSSPDIVNCLFSGNLSDVNGGAINLNGASGGTSTSKIINCTFSGNRALNWGGAIRTFGDGASPVFINTLVWNNSASAGASLLSSNGASASFSHSLLQGFFPPGPGVLNGFGTTNDPKFILPIDPANAPTTAGDYRLGIGSPVIGVGINDSLSAGDTLDVAGGARIFDQNVDLGALEFRYEFPCGAYDTLVVDESPITGAEYKAESLIQSASVVNNLSVGPVIFNSKHSIQLFAEFEVVQGAVFEAKTENPCIE